MDMNIAVMNTYFGCTACDNDVLGLNSVVLKCYSKIRPAYIGVMHPYTACLVFTAATQHADIAVLAPYIGCNGCNIHVMDCNSP